MRQKSLPVGTPPQSQIVSPTVASDTDILFGGSGKVTHRPMTEEEQRAIANGGAPNMKLSDAEKRQLLKMGWTEGSPVPDNVAEMFASVVSSYKAEAVKRGALPQELVVREFDDLPTQEQERMRQSLREATDAMKSGRGQVVFSEYPADAAHVLDVESLPMMEIPDWRTEPAPPMPSQEPAPVSAPEAEPARIEPTKAASSTNQRCVHCGGDPFEDMTKSPIPLEDKKAYLLSIGTGRSFEKEYSLFHDTVRVRFRTLRPGEYDLIAAWAYEKALKEVRWSQQNLEAYVNVLRRHEATIATALQTVYLKGTAEGSSLFWSAPKGQRPGLKDWEADYGSMTLDDLLDRFNEAVGAEALIAGIRDRLAVFNLLDHRLTLNVNDTENFWRGT